MDTATLVDLLEENPSKALSLPEQVRTPEVFDAFIRRCLALVDSNPDRNEVLKVIGDVLERVKERWSFFAPEARKGFAPIYPALVAVRRAALRDVVSVSVEEVEAGIKSAVERLRRACGEGMLPCLLSWPE